MDFAEILNSMNMTEEAFARNYPKIWMFGEKAKILIPKEKEAKTAENNIVDLLDSYISEHFARLNIKVSDTPVIYKKNYKKAADEIEENFYEVIKKYYPFIYILE